jgi:hypothetical protein
VILDEDARKMFLALDKSVRVPISKKLIQLERDDFGARHLKFGAPDFLANVGQYRIVFKKREAEKIKLVAFVGDHKHYAEWYASFFRK